MSEAYVNVNKRPIGLPSDKVDEPDVLLVWLVGAITKSPPSS